MKTKLLLILMIILLCSGCDLFQKRSKTTIPEFNTGKDISQAQSIVEKSTKEIKKATGDISKETLSIKKEIDQIKGRIPTELKEKIDIHLDKINKSSNTILEKTQDINKSVAELSGATSLLNNAGEKITTIEKALGKITKERDAAIIARDEAEADSKSQTRKTLQWIIFGSILGFGGSVALLLMGSSKVGIMGIGASLSILLLSIVISAHLVLISWIGMGIILLILLYLIYESFVQGKIKKELIKTTELVKKKLSDEEKESIFGKKSEVKRVQSERTSNEVKKIKGKKGFLDSL